MTKNVQPFIKTGVIGHPIAHSKSPLIHNHWIAQYDLNGLYEAIDISPESLRDGVKALVEQGYRGFNVTVPHKQAIMEICDHIDPLAQTIGAVNTVSIENGTLHGTNTDAYGFVENIKSRVPDWSFAQKSALVLGAGGAANAVIYALLQQDVRHITLCNRTRTKADDLAAYFDTERVEVVDWDFRDNAVNGAGLIINTTSLGMSGQPPLTLDLSAAPKGCLVHDIVYAPLMTNLLNDAKSHGLPYVTGIGMLLHQARPGFEKWNGILPDVTAALERLVLD